MKSCFLKRFSKGVFSIEEQIGIFLVLDKPQDKEDAEEEEEEVTGRVDAAKKNSEDAVVVAILEFENFFSLKVEQRTTLLSTLEPTGQEFAKHHGRNQT